MNERDSDPAPDSIVDILRPVLEAQRRKVEDHERLRASEPYQAVIKHLDRMASDFGLAVNAIDVMATRHSPFFDSKIMLRAKPHLTQSLVAAIWSIKEGMLDPARRELRFLLEASVKALWLDKGGERTDGTQIGPNDSVDQKVSTLDDLGRRKFAEIVAELEFGLLPPEAQATYRSTATDLYSKLSTYSHVSKANVEQDLRNFGHGRAFGFETVRELEAITKQAKRVLDLSLASQFEAFDHGLVGDIIVQVFDDEPKWAFRRTPLVGAIDRHFDYKAERR